MKKHLLGLAALFLLLVATSCVKETRESVTDGDGNLSFRTVLGKQTLSRATEQTNSNWAPDVQLDVFAYTPGYDALVNKFELKYKPTDKTWSYLPVFHQPGYPLAYYSVHPTTNLSDVTYAKADHGTYSFGYTVPATYDKQEDLIAAYVASTIDTEIDLEYKHLLSQVNFAVVGIVATQIEVKDIKIEDVMSKNTYTMPYVAGPAPLGGWGNTPTVAADYDYVPTPNAFGVFVTEGDVGGTIYMGNGGGKYDNSNALMLLPQMFDPNKNGADGMLTFSYRLTVDTNGNEEFDDVGGFEVKTGGTDGYETVSVPLGHFDTKTWAPGYRYVYVIDFSSYLAGGEITFKVKVLDWKDDDHNDVVETIHVATNNVHSIEAAIALHSSANAAKADMDTFPIAIYADLSGGDDLTITKIYGFDTKDVIRIECDKNESALKIKTDVQGWGAPVVEGRFVTITCESPVVKGLTVDAATGDVAGIEDAIEALGASNAGPSFVEYTVNVGAVSATTEITTFGAGTYFVGDRIRVLCDNDTSAGNVTTSDTAWTRKVQNDTEVLFTKNK